MSVPGDHLETARERLDRGRMCVATRVVHLDQIGCRCIAARRQRRDPVRGSVREESTRGRTSPQGPRVEEASVVSLPKKSWLCAAPGSPGKTMDRRKLDENGQAMTHSGMLPAAAGAAGPPIDVNTIETTNAARMGSRTEADGNKQCPSVEGSSDVVEPNEFVPTDVVDHVDLLTAEFCFHGGGLGRLAGSTILGAAAARCLAKRRSSPSSARERDASVCSTHRISDHVLVAQNVDSTTVPRRRQAFNAARTGASTGTSCRPTGTTRPGRRGPIPAQPRRAQNATSPGPQRPRR